ncbi:MAG: VCBS repeat-containing protein [Cyclobacteriaceae bacterium]|nr:VCBS repeat-containing protein [Cyclobacteriaceae bacterium]
MKPFFAILLFFSSLAVHAQITITFDVGAEGWTATHTGGTAATFNHQVAGGNPGGFVSVAPPTAGGSVNTSFAWYWNAPSTFFGNYDFSYGSNLKLDLQQSVAGTDNTVSDVIIYSGGNTLHFNFATKPAVSPAWTSYTIALDETAGWRWNSVGGSVALKAQIKIVLANITGIRIRCKYSNTTGYTSGLDNVTLEKRTLETSPVITSFAPASALAGETVIITGSNFGSTKDNNMVYFGLVRATVVSGNATQLTVQVPSAATLAPISVINTAASLVAVSTSNFQPLIFSDPDFIGHLLPGSFSNNVIVPYGDFNDNGLAGGAMGDIDGDGWLDIVAFEDPGEFAIFLNQGQSGNLSSSSFAPKVQIPSGELGQGNSNGTILHDFDNDGKIDIATYFRGASPQLTGGFTISRNISTPGTVSFEPAEQFYNVGIFCSGFDVADLDGDGRLDFLLNSSGLYFAQNISTPGNIEFATLRFLNASGGAVSTKDLNGDGKPEIMVVASGSFNLLENISTEGNIQFAAPLNFPGSAVSGITLADLDSDTKPDILYYRINGFNDYDLVIKKNIHTTGVLSTASFDADIILSKVGRAYSQRVADLNGDGKPDILIALNSGSIGYSFGVFESKVEPGILNTSSFLPLIEYEETSNGALAIPLIGDLNGDLLPDVVGFASSDGGEHGLILYTNQTIAAPNISVNTVSPLAAPVGSTVTITGNKFSSDITKNTVWFGAVKANVLTASKNEITVTVPPGASYERVSVTRDNRTSRYHLPFSTTFSSGVTFDGTSFAAPVTFPVTGADYDVEAADLNGDGKPELIAESRVVTGIIRNYAWSFENVHTTGAITSSSFIISDTTNESALNLRMVDLDEDGRLDILSQQALFRNSTTTNEIEFDNNVNGAGGGNQNWADFDLDGKTDVIAANTGGATLLLYRNTSKPGPFRTGAFATFGAALGLSKPAVNGGTAVGDFDNDGFVEFASTNPTSDNMRVWRNNGGFPLSTAQFSVVGDLPTGDNPGRLYSGDFDQDGKLDLLLYHGTGTNNTMLTIFHNTSTAGNISFTRIDLTNPSATTVATIADLDGDGKPEIITTSESGNRFSIFKNIHTSGALTAASFAAPFNTTVTAPRGITTGDLNLDGKPEIILTRAAGLLVVYENLVPTVAITITQQPASPYYACEGGTASFTTAASGTTNITYQWQKFDGSVFVDLVNNTKFSGVNSPTLAVSNVTASESGEYHCVISGDFAAPVTTNSANLVFNSLPSPPDVTNGVSCGPGVVLLTASGGSPGDYRWYSGSPLTLIAAEQNETFITPSLTANTTYHVSLRSTFCESVPVPVTAIISTPPAKPVITASVTPVGGEVTACASTVLTLSAPAGFSDYQWFDSSGYPFGSVQTITVTASDIYSVLVVNANGCSSEVSDELIVTIVPEPCVNTAPVINTTALSTTLGQSITVDLLSLISDADDNLVLSSLTIVQQPQSGATASINGTNLLINYTGLSFTGNDAITIRVCDVFGACTTQTLEINVIGEIEIYNAVSPNGDDKNAYFRIENIEALEPENTVTIYNRWGSKVFEVENYKEANAFRGLNQNGNELPSGTYFYKIFFISTGKTQHGFLVLKR